MTSGVVWYSVVNGLDGDNTPIAYDVVWFDINLYIAYEPHTDDVTHVMLSCYIYCYY